MIRAFALALGLLVIEAMALSSLPSREKRRRLEDLEQFRRRLPHMSQSALAAVCKDIQQHGLPDDFSRRAQQESRNMIRGVNTEYGPIIRAAKLVRSDNAGPVSVEYANAWALVHHIAGRSGALAKLIQRRHGESPSSARKPWNHSV